MMETTGIPAEQGENRQAFLRYLPRRIAAFERRILRYRFDGWEPSGMMLLGVDLQRLADASDAYGLADTRQRLLTLAQTIRDHVASMRSPDPSQTTRLFSMLTAVIKSLPPDQELPPQSAPKETAPQAELKSAVADSVVAPMPTPIVEPIAPVVASTPESTAAVEPVESIETDSTIDATETLDRLVPDAPVESTAMNESRDLAEPDAPTVTVEPSESDEPVASIPTFESSESVEPVATVATAEPGEPLHPIEEPSPDAAILTTEPIQHVEPVQAEPAASAASAEPTEPEELDETDTSGEGGVRRVYHLRDGNAFALELEKRLEAEGYAIEPVDSLEELSELLTCLMPQVLLVDASHLSELAAIGELRREAQKRSQPPRRIQMAVLAAQDSMETRRLAHRAGVDLLLLPPFDIARFSERLQVLHASAAEQKVRVLIVEDNRADALYAQTVLSNAGMHAQVEDDPMHVLEALKSLHPDLVLMDLHMPFANGVEVTMLIREHPVFARLPIVFLSGESDPDSQLEAINAGGDDFLFKPIRPRHLIDAVRDRMRRLHPVEKQHAERIDGT